MGHVRTPRSHQSFHKYAYAFIPFTVNNRKRKIINWYWVANTNNFSLADPTRRLPAFQSSTERAWNRLGLYRSFCMYAYADLYYLKHLAVVTGEVEEIGNSQSKSYNFIFFFCLHPERCMLCVTRLIGRNLVLNNNIVVSNGCSWLGLQTLAWRCLVLQTSGYEVQKKAVFYGRYFFMIETIWAHLALNWKRAQYTNE